MDKGPRTLNDKRSGNQEPVKGQRSELESTVLWKPSQETCGEQSATCC